MSTHAFGEWIIEFIEGDHVRPQSNQCVSYLDDATQVLCTWTGAASTHLACDAERFDRPVRVGIVNRFDFPDEPQAFADRWTVAEVQAKVTDTPIMHWLRHPCEAEHAEVQTITLETERAVVSVGRVV